MMAFGSQWRSPSPRIFISSCRLVLLWAPATVSPNRLTAPAISPCPIPSTHSHLTSVKILPLIHLFTVFWTPTMCQSPACVLWVQGWVVPCPWPWSPENSQLLRADKYQLGHFVDETEGEGDSHSKRLSLRTPENRAWVKGLHGGSLFGKASLGTGVGDMEGGEAHLRVWCPVLSWSPQWATGALFPRNLQRNPPECISESSPRISPPALILCGSGLHRELSIAWHFLITCGWEPGEFPPASSAENSEMPRGREPCKCIHLGRGGCFCNGWDKRRTSNISITKKLLKIRILMAHLRPTGSDSGCGLINLHSMAKPSNGSTANVSLRTTGLQNRQTGYTRGLMQWTVLIQDPQQLQGQIQIPK